MLALSLSFSFPSRVWFGHVVLEKIITTPDDPLRTSHHAVFVAAFFIWSGLGFGLGLILGHCAGSSRSLGDMLLGWISGVIGWGRQAVGVCRR